MSVEKNAVQNHGVWSMQHHGKEKEKKKIWLSAKVPSQHRSQFFWSGWRSHRMVQKTQCGFMGLVVLDTPRLAQLSLRYLR